MPPSALIPVLFVSVDSMMNLVRDIGLGRFLTAARILTRWQTLMTRAASDAVNACGIAVSAPHRRSRGLIKGRFLPHESDLGLQVLGGWLSPMVLQGKPRDNLKPPPKTPVTRPLRLGGIKCRRTFQKGLDRRAILSVVLRCHMRIVADGTAAASLVPILSGQPKHPYDLFRCGLAPDGLKAFHHVVSGHTDPGQCDPGRNGAAQKA